MANDKQDHGQTIMLKEKAEMYRQLFIERHEKALKEDIHSLSDMLKTFHGDKVTVWHCCTYDGDGYYTISDGVRKCFVRSAYELEKEGGIWSMDVYERLYMGQMNLMKFLEAVKAEISSKFAAEMPLKTLYIEYILTDLKMEHSFSGEFEIARKYQTEFTERYPEQIEAYTSIAENGGDFWDYYNGSENYEYSFVSEILTESILRIYDKRKELEACGEWEKAREAIDMLRNCKYMVRNKNEE